MTLRASSKSSKSSKSPNSSQFPVPSPKSPKRNTTSPFHLFQTQFDREATLDILPKHVARLGRIYPQGYVHTPAKTKDQT